jgi:hypothetical protein
VRWSDGELLIGSVAAALVDVGSGAHPREGAAFARLPKRATKKPTWTSWQRELKEHVYQKQPLTIYRSKAHKLVGASGETEAAFRARVRQAEVEARDEAIDRLRTRYAKKVDAATEKVRRAEEALGREEADLEERTQTSWVSVGSSILDALFSRKKTARAAATAATKRAKVARSKEDVERAERELEVRKHDLADIEAELRVELAELPGVPAATEVDVEVVVVHPRKADIDVSPLTVVWTPCVIAGGG